MEEDKHRCKLCRWGWKRYTEEALTIHQSKEHSSCLSCGSFLHKRHKGLKCLNNHHLCESEYTANFIESKMSDRSFPIKCSICAVPISSTILKKHMTACQRTVYECSLEDLGSQSTYLQCGNCNQSPTAVNLNIQNGLVVFPCKGCSYSTCVSCSCTFNNVESSPQTQQSVLDHNQQCFELLPLKLAFEQAIADGTAFKCPKCGRGGRKDYGCILIHCDGCSGTWCYICGKSNVALFHNCNADIYRPSPSTMFSPEAALECLHRTRTLQLLHTVYLKYGAMNFKRLWNCSESIRAHGYSLSEITNPFENCDYLHCERYEGVRDDVFIVIMSLLFVAILLAFEYV